MYRLPPKTQVGETAMITAYIMTFAGLFAIALAAAISEATR
jgi:hypothetical protein